MHPDALPAWLHWTVKLEQSSLGVAMRESLLLYPAVELIHIAGFALLIGSITVVDLRLLGLLGRLDLKLLARSVVPISLTGLAMALPSGLLLFTASASSLVQNPFLQLKLAAVLLALANALWFELVTFRRLRDGDVTGSRWAGALSLILWIVALFSGRLIAYL